MHDMILEEYGKYIVAGLISCFFIVLASQYFLTEGGPFYDALAGFIGMYYQ